MEFTGDGLDELLHGLYDALANQGSANSAARGDTLELLGVTLRLTNPRARLSRSESRGKIFSALGELLWYWSGSNTLEFIQPYIKRYEDEVEDGVIFGAYGPRLRAMRGIDQLSNIERLLRKKPGTRRAVVQLFNAEDINAHHEDIPCTTTVQFLLRDGRLHCSVTMRSNDAYFGLPHDVFCFTMIQEVMACRLGVTLGDYLHYVGSMHAYTTHLSDMKIYSEEGWQRAIAMPPMPAADPFEAVDALLKAETRLRNGERVDAEAAFAEPYWADLLRLLQIFWEKKDASTDAERLQGLRNGFAHPVYRPYAHAHLRAKRGAAAAESAPNVASTSEQDVAK